MKRRAFISKTALAAIAAPLLPTALATAPPKPTRPKWGCIALCRNGMDTDATLQTNDIDDVLWFIEAFTDANTFYRVEIYAHGKLFNSYNLVHYNNYHEWIPIFYRHTT